MRSRMLGQLLTAALLLGSGIAGAANKQVPAGPQTDDQIAKRLAHEIAMYSRYTIWDDIEFQVANGQVDLTGAVSAPYKKQDVESIARKVAGVTSVTDGIKVLPPSSQDDRLRMQIARAIYGDSPFDRYAWLGVGPVHIIVDNGHVTLAGVVNSESEKNIAWILASGAGLSFGPVTNNLVVEHPPARKG